MKLFIFTFLFWSFTISGFAQVDTLTSSDAAIYTGQDVVFTGTVVSTYYAWNKTGAPTFLNIDKPYPNNPVTVLIFEEYLSLFGNVDSLIGKQVVVSGYVDTYSSSSQNKDLPCVRLTSAHQLQILE